MEVAIRDMIIKTFFPFLISFISIATIAFVISNNHRISNSSTNELFEHFVYLLSDGYFYFLSLPFLCLFILLATIAIRSSLFESIANSLIRFLEEEVQIDPNKVFLNNKLIASYFILASIVHFILCFLFIMQVSADLYSYNPQGIFHSPNPLTGEVNSHLNLMPPHLITPFLIASFCLTSILISLFYIIYFSIFFTKLIFHNMFGTAKFARPNWKQSDEDVNYLSNISNSK